MPLTQRRMRPATRRLWKRGAAAWLPLLLLLAAGCRQRSSQLPAGGGYDAVKLMAAEAGMVRVSLAALQEAGLALDAIAVDSLSLTHQGEQVPYLVAGDELIFYGQPPESRYAAARPYVLKTGEPGLPMDSRAAAAGSGAAAGHLARTIHLEENHNYLAESRTADSDDVWFWQRIGQGQKVSLAFELGSPAALPATLTFHLYGVTHNPGIENDHDFDLLLNGQRLGMIQGEGQGRFSGSLAVPAGALKAGRNQLVLDNEVDGAAFLDIMELDRVALSFQETPAAVSDYYQFSGADGRVAVSRFSGKPRLFEISDPDRPRLLTGWAYSDGSAELAATPDMQVAAVGPEGYRQPAAIEPFSAGNWHDTGLQADLIIIAPHALTPALAPLVEARTAQGLAVQLVPAEEVYDGFGDGYGTPDSLNAFIRYAYQEWQPPQPKYLLLVGDATSDYRGYLGSPPPFIIPAPMVPVAYSGETVSDARLADIDGDLKPELAVGRWPVSSAAEVESLVSRTLAYEAGEASQRALFVADGTEDEFQAAAERLTAHVESAGGGVVLSGVRADELLGQWNQGSWLTTYVGHGSVERWGKEDIFDPEAVDGFAPGTPPIVLQLTCLSGLFAHPQLRSLSETMMAHPNGPVLLVAATSLTLSSHQEQFAVPFLTALADPAVVRIGDAFQSAKESLEIRNNQGLREISDTYVLLGDPSAVIVRPHP